MAKISYPDRLGELAEQIPDAVAIICGDRSITRRELDIASNRLARVFAGQGVGEGDMLTIGLPNCIDWFVACMAAWKLGAIPNPISPDLPRRERMAIIERADPVLIIGVDKIEAEGRAFIPRGFEVPESVSGEALPDMTSAHIRALTSGGSTGVPKLIIPKSPALYDPNSPLSFFNARECALVPGPLYHAVPFSTAWYGLFAGAKVVVMAGFDALECLDLIDRHKVDRIWFVPTMMLRIARLPEEQRLARNVSSVDFVMSVGAPCPSWLMQFWIDWLGAEVMNETFGSSERIGGTLITGVEWLKHPGSVGKPVGGVRMKIVDPKTALECETGELGEIYMIPPGGPGSSFKYIGAERSFADEGWESIGDMGYVDADGYLYIGDRRSDMILVRGRNIFPAELEAAIEEHPVVRSSAVIGFPDEDLGQRIHAIVEVSEELEEQQLREHMKERLVYYKIPRTFEFVTSPLRNDAGKVRRSALREERLAKMEKPA
tara:strand:- start:809 stop:2278 length:1470 start_codon:yes stop_codon:yes gene_type:complete